MWDCAKIILYPDDKQFADVAEFYGEDLGLPVKAGANTYWTEFTAGSTQICLHFNNRYEEKTSKQPTRSFFVLSTTDRTAVANLHTLLIANGYTVANGTLPDDAHRLGELHTLQDGCPVFLVADPLGNVIQCESLHPLS